MKKEILWYLERILSATISTLACIGMFVVVNFFLHMFWDGEVTTKIMLVILVVCMIAIYLLQQALLIVRYNRIAILADELEEEKFETAQEIAERWEQQHGHKKAADDMEEKLEDHYHEQSKLR